jgi:hypothetical protein
MLSLPPPVSFPPCGRFHNSHLHMAGPAPYLFHLSLSSGSTRQIGEEKPRSSKRGHGQAPRRDGRPQEHRSRRAPRPEGRPHERRRGRAPRREGRPRDQQRSSAPQRSSWPRGATCPGELPSELTAGGRASVVSQSSSSADPGELLGDFFFFFLYLL